MKKTLNRGSDSFKNTKTKKLFQTTSNDKGDFDNRLPYSNTCQIKIKGFTEDADYTKFTIPVLHEGQNRLSYKINNKFKPAKTFTLKNVHFQTGKATLTTESYNQLEDLLKYMKLKKQTIFEISGHTDSVGDEVANLALSQRRVDGVRELLISNGIVASRIIAVGYGETHPINSSETTEGLQANRRTEVRLLNYSILLF